jgi:anti-sigma B factor antagonist
MIRRDDGAMVVHARGELDFLAAAGLREVVLDAVEHAGPSGVALDLSAVTFIDSVSLAALVSGFKTAHATGLPFAVSAASPTATDLLQMTGLARLWQFSPDIPPTVHDSPGLAPVG